MEITIFPVIWKKSSNVLIFLRAFVIFVLLVKNFFPIFTVSTNFPIRSNFWNFIIYYPRLEIENQSKCQHITAILIMLELLQFTLWFGVLLIFYRLNVFKSLVSLLTSALIPPKLRSAIQCPNDCVSSLTNMWHLLSIHFHTQILIIWLIMLQLASYLKKTILKHV